MGPGLLQNGATIIRPKKEPGFGELILPDKNVSHEYTEASCMAFRALGHESIQAVDSTLFYSPAKSSPVYLTAL